MPKKSLFPMFPTCSHAVTCENIFVPQFYGNKLLRIILVPQPRGTRIKPHVTKPRHINEKPPRSLFPFSSTPLGVLEKQAPGTGRGRSKKSMSLKFDTCPHCHTPITHTTIPLQKVWNLQPLTHPYPAIWEAVLAVKRIAGRWHDIKLAGPWQPPDHHDTKRNYLWLEQHHCHHPPRADSEPITQTRKPQQLPDTPPF